MNQQAPLRFEDEPLLRGTGRFTDDEKAFGEAFGAFVRSPHAAARIVAVETSEALCVPGVLAILTADDIEAAGLGNVCVVTPVPGGSALHVPHRPVLARGAVRHVGEAVALVVADTEAAARDAVDRVAVAYEATASVTATGAAMALDAPQLWPEAPRNMALDWVGPGSDAQTQAKLDGAFAEAAHVARVSLVNQRIVMAPLEPRAAMTFWDTAAQRYEIHCASQSAAVLRNHLCRIMGVPPEGVRVVTGDVGGAFGMRTTAYPEYPALMLAARRVGRPVRWLATRSEGFVSDNQARDTLLDAELALDGSGRFLGLRIQSTANMGAYLSSHGAFIATFNFARCLPAMYDIPLLSVRMHCVFTNTLPTGPYRGAGRPEANYVLERLIDEAALVTGMDGLSLRRCNLIAPDQMPYATPVGTRFDSGEFAAVIDKAVALADLDGYPERRRLSEQAGKRRGLGVGCFLEIAGGQPGEGAAIGFPGGSDLLLTVGAGASGQGHQTVYRRLAAAQLGIPVEQIRIAGGDSADGVPSAGAVASRCTMSVGSAVAETVEAVIEKGRHAAAHILEAAEADISYRDGLFEIAGTDRRIALFALAEQARDLTASGMLDEALDSKRQVDTPSSFPNGCHIAEVEIDPETGRTQLARYAAVDDCGVVLQPILVEGQVHGGVAQGAGQALMETGIYDRNNGQFLSGTFADYAMPRADDLPMISTEMHPVPCTTNRLGVKGVGEAGTTGALAAIMNAMANALPPGARLDMPATPERVWRAIQNAKAKR